jgi:hypothetical protein
MANLFQAVASNPSLIADVVDAMRSASSSAGFTIADDPLQFVQMASDNTPFRSAVESRLSQFAAAHGLSFEPEASASVSGAKAALTALMDKPTTIPIGTPIALLFIAAALIFLPSIFSVVGQIMFGSDNTAHAMGR